MLENYFKAAFRSILKQRSYNVLNVLGLAVGISSGLIIALHIKEEVSFEKSFPDYQNIYRVHREGWATSSPPLAKEFVDFFPEVEAIARFSPYGTRVVTTDKNNPGEATGYYADSTVLKVFGFKVIDGDPHPLRALNTAVITRQMAHRYFGDETPRGNVLKNGDQKQSIVTAVGKVLKFDNQKEFTVTAVIEDPPVNSHLKFDYLISMPTFYTDGREGADRNRGWMIMYSYARIRPGSFDHVSGRLPQFIRKFYTGDPDVEQEVATGGWQLMPLRDIHLRSNLEKEMAPNNSIVYIYVFAAVELLILIVASANFMSLFTTLATRRVKEVGMRKIMGARPFHLMIQFLTEVLLLVFFSAILGIVFYQIALPFYNELSGNNLQPWQIFQRDNVLTLGIILITVIIISGLYPAFFIAGFKAGSFLKVSKLPSAMPNVVRNTLVIFQFVVSVSLIASAIIVHRQMNLVKNKDLGFDKEQVVSIKLYGRLWWRVMTEGDLLKNEFLKSPDILAVGLAGTLIGERLSVESVWPEGVDPEAEFPDVRVLRVDEGYLDVMNIELVTGRNFSRKFNDSTSYIINESAAHVMGLNSPVNETLISYSRGNRKGKIVGVVKDYHFASLHAEIEPLVIEYEPSWTDHMIVKIRAGKTRETIDYIEHTVHALAPNSLFVYDFLDDRVNMLYKKEDTMGKAFQFFSALAIIIACLGLFGLSAFTIEIRTKEIGIRKVLGASVKTIITLLTGNFLWRVLIAQAIAFPLVYYMARDWLQNFAYRIDIGWQAFALAGAASILIAVITVSVQTLRAAFANPVDSLRNE